MKPWVMTDSHPEEKYLVVRRDGTIPKWPHFVLGGHDPASAAALEAYADAAERLGYDPEFCAGVRELAAQYGEAAEVAYNAGLSDPDAGPHRTDNPHVVAMMRGEGDLSGLGGLPPPSRAAHLSAGLGKVAHLLRQALRGPDNAKPAMEEALQVVDAAFELSAKAGSAPAYGDAGTQAAIRGGQ